jgi:hypothetical protein
VVAGTARHGYDLELRRYNGRGWRAVVLVEGRRAFFYFEPEYVRRATKVASDE